MCVYAPYLYPFIYCFCVLAFVNSVAVNIGVDVYFLNRIFFLDICPGVGFLDHMVTLFFVF